MRERDTYLLLTVCDGIGPATLEKLLTHFGTSDNVWDASVDDLRLAGMGPKLASHLAHFRETFDSESYFKHLEKADVWFVTKREEAYPKPLKTIHNAPAILYGKGNKSLLDQELLRLGVVGTRKITDYGRQVTELLVTELVASNVVIVSGLAMGVDALAHQSTLLANGKTIAVLGSGVDYCTPQENVRLYEAIVEQDGLILSEMPLRQLPNKGSFPARNRIIAGLSQGVLVTEGAEDSGSLITAKFAISEGRTVFAVPGPITSTVSKGPIALIERGAKMVTNAKDILTVLGIESKEREIKKIIGDTPEEQKILDVLQNENVAFDDIVKRTKLSSSKIGTLLSLLELKAVVTHLDDGLFSIR